MAILGRLDASTFANTVAVTQNSATVTKNAADEIDQGDIIELGGVPYLVKQVNTTTQITLHTEYAAADNATLAGAVRRTAPKAVAEYIIKGGDSASYELIFVDATEQAISSNKSRGIWGPGWWKYRTFVDASGNTRHKSECIAALQATAVVAGDDADDTIAADVLEVITITTDVADNDQTGNAPFTGVLFTAIATVDQSGTLTAQWQRRTAATGRWTNVTATLDSNVYSVSGDGGGTSAAGGSVSGVASGATIQLIGTAVPAGLDGYEYRVKLTSSKGAEEVISASGTLTIS